MYILQHAWVQLGDEWPDIPRRDIIHMQGRSDGVDLDIWYITTTEEEENG